MNQSLLTSNSDNWATPLSFFNKIDHLYNFTLDVAADDLNHKCENYYTIADNGLWLPWKGRVWCNPPYGRGIGEWVKKAWEQHQALKTPIVMLLPARTDTKWMHEYVFRKASIIFLTGRLKFGDGKAPAPFPSMLAIYDQQPTMRYYKLCGAMGGYSIQCDRT